MYKMLVVDDEMDVCDFVKHFFEERNYEVQTALDGEDAVRIVAQESFDVILLDIKMKRMSGIETLEKIKKARKDANVIMVTAVEDQGSMDAACKLGACEYITKPLVLEELESSVYEKTRKRASNDENTQKG